MAAWRILGSMVLVLATAQAGWAQTYTLIETPRVGACFHLRLEMKLSGEIRVFQEGKVLPLTLAATATHTFPERVLAVGPEGVAHKTARYYETARAGIIVNGAPSERTLRPERRVLVAQRVNDRTVVYSPSGALTREELALTGEHLDTLALTGLLPGRAVAIGETWKVANLVAQALCGFEGLTTQDLTCKLEAVQDNVATVSVTGSASGIETGALVKLTIQSNYRFDIGSHYLTRLEWKLKDERDQGPASPALTVETTTTLTRTTIEEPKELSDIALVKVPDGEPAAALLHLHYRDPQERFDLIHSRDWHLVGQTDDHIILRLLDRGDFVAQATITPWTRAKPGEHLSAEAFEKAMAQTPFWEAEQVLQAGEVPMEGGRWVYRLSAIGLLEGNKVMQNFYLIASPSGQQIVVAFTLNQAKAEKLGTRDLSLVGSLELLPVK